MWRELFFPLVRVTVDDPWIWSAVKEYYKLKLAFREYQYCCKIWSSFKEQEQTQAIFGQNGGCAGVALLVNLAGAMLCWTAFFIYQFCPLLPWSLSKQIFILVQWIPAYLPVWVTTVYSLLPSECVMEMVPADGLGFLWHAWMSLPRQALTWASCVRFEQKHSQPMRNLSSLQKWARRKKKIFMFF